MTRVAMALLTRDRVEKTRRSLDPLWNNDSPFDLFWIDGSSTEEGIEYAQTGNENIDIRVGIYGGADAAIVYALTQMLAKDGQYIGGKAYTHVGLCENDVLLDSNWYYPTIDLFDRGQADGMEVGAVSARCYEDRIFFQRPGYAICHNLGAGHTILTREAATIILNHYRTGWTAENRAIFAQLSGIDIGSYWAFRGSNHHLTADWSWNAILAAHGLASLALTPSKASMMEDIAAQGLTLAICPVNTRRDDQAYQQFFAHLRQVRTGARILPMGKQIHHNPESGIYTVFPHQIPLLGGSYGGKWTLKWSQGLGPFAYRASENATCVVPVYGPCQVLVGGSPNGGHALIDAGDGYAVRPQLPPEKSGQILRVTVPTGGYRPIRLTALTPGIVFHGIETREPQPTLTEYQFDYSSLPKVPA
jgi:hypothetical protein